MRQVQCVVVSDGRVCREATAITCGHLRGEILREHIFDKPAGYLIVRKAHGLLLGRIKAHNPETALGRNIQQKHANRDVVEDLFVLQFEFVQRRSGPGRKRGTSKAVDLIFQLADARKELQAFLN